MTVGEAIRYFRLRRKLTQAMLGELIGVSSAAISKWETGTGLPDVAILVSLARGLGTTTGRTPSFWRAIFRIRATLEKYSEILW